MSVTTRNIAITFDTVSDMINDKDIKLGMVVQTLGKNSVNDNYGAIYKIMSNPDGNVGTNNYALKKKPLLKAVRINSSSNEDRIRTLEKGISDTNKEVANINAKLTGIINCDVFAEIKALSGGVKVVCLSNGQKAIVVTDVVEAAVATLELGDEDYETTESTNTEENGEPAVINEDEIEVIAEEVESPDDENVSVSLTDNIAKITIKVTADRSWLIPSTFELLSGKISEVYLNDNCSIIQSSGNITLTVNRQLNPAIYYYI